LKTLAVILLQECNSEVVIKMLKLKSIKGEAVDCRKAFKKFPVGGYVLHYHHDIIGEMLRENAENRIAYILTQKPENERALRLRLFRPIHDKELKAYAEWKKAYAEWKKADAEWKKADAEWEKAYAEWKKADAEWKKAYAEWKKADAALGILVHAYFCTPDCPWNGKTIFP
jgi:hypothetical protein